MTNDSGEFCCSCCSQHHLPFYFLILFLLFSSSARLFVRLKAFSCIWRPTYKLHISILFLLCFETLSSCYSAKDLAIGECSNSLQYQRKKEQKRILSSYFFLFYRSSTIHSSSRQTLGNRARERKTNKQNGGNRFCFIAGCRNDEERRHCDTTGTMSIMNRGKQEIIRKRRDTKEIMAQSCRNSH